MLILKDKVALISGANSPMGIGAAIARVLSSYGAACFLTYLRRPGQQKKIPADMLESADAPGWPLYAKMAMKSADEVVEEIIESDGEASAWEADLAEPENIPMLFDKVEAEFGPVDILVNNAAHCPDEDSLIDLTAQSIDQTYAVNVRASLLLMKEFVKRFKKYQLQSGRIINVSTGPAQEFSGQIAYGTSKAAIEAATRAIALEVGPLNNNQHCCSWCHADRIY
jgi:3-oxoacyl-[acyl-carrier protein] reductase